MASGHRSMPLPGTIGGRTQPLAEVEIGERAVTLRDGDRSLSLRVLDPADVTIEVADVSAPQGASDFPNPGLKRICVRCAARGGILRVVAAAPTAAMVRPPDLKPLDD